LSKLLVTGGAGYIGSHSVLELQSAGYEIVVLDNLSNSREAAIQALNALAGGGIEFVRGDLLDPTVLADLFNHHSFDAVLHFAGLKAVGESVAHPLMYYSNNVTGTLNLLHAMSRAHVKTLVFSSSATVYGEAESVPLGEDTALQPTNPYGRSKQIIEQILTDLSVSDRDWKISILRYFNPVGAHSSGEIGEDPTGIPNNLVPYIAQVAVGRLPFLRIFGNDYETADGTGVRDYIHVVDLAQGHLAALRYLTQHSGCFIHNLGSGHGHSVREVLAAFEKACGKRLPVEVFPRRPGDIGMSYADPAKANRELKWQTQRTLEDMCRDAWHWQTRHPNGFK